jgi:hypothetical protein
MLQLLTATGLPRVRGRDGTSAASGQLSFAERMREVAEPIRSTLVAYLERKQATCQTKTVSCLASRLTDFGRFLSVIDPSLTSLADLDRRHHIEPYLTALVHARNSKKDGEISVAELGRRVIDRSQGSPGCRTTLHG